MTLDAATTVVAPAAVLWDMDGTLVDTEPYWMECERELVDAYGGRWTEEDARSIIGFDLLDAATVLRERGGVDLAPTEIVERMLDGVIARVRTSVPWRPGARRLLTELNEMGVPCALVTMSWRRLVDVIVEELAPIAFQTVVTGDDVEHGKPHPQPYLLAASRLEVDPAECVAIEDSPTGIASAAGAGCVVVAVPNIVPIEAAPGRIVVPSLKGVSPQDLGTYLAETPPPGAVVPDEPAAEQVRRRRGLIGLGALGAIAAVAIAVAAIDRGDGEPVARTPGALDVQAWTPPWAIEEALPSLPARAASFGELSPFFWRVTGVDSIEVADGTDAALAEEFLTTARDADVPLVASIFDDTEAGVMAAILADPDQRTRHVEAVASFAADGDFDGIDIDYEQFAFADGRDSWVATRPNWVTFIEELSTRLHDDGRTLTVSIPPVYDTGRTDDSGYWVYDYAAITPLVDTIRVMAYDYSVASGEPGPIAPLPWVERVIAGTSAASGDPSKLVLGIPLYGYNWVVATAGTCPTTAEGNISLSTRDMADLAVRRGATPTPAEGDGEMTFSYDLEVSDATTTCTQSRQVHYVDGDGAGVRTRLAVDAGFRGISLFAFGYEDEAAWAGIDAIARELLQPATTVVGD